jgi:3-hydroxyacyl-[acyl-carrier-protein] dehydratase
MRFQLIDQVTEQQPDRVTAVKAVTAAEEYLADHFPGFPVLPGVMMLEALVQAARVLLDRQTAEGEASGDGGKTSGGVPWVLAEARNIRYGNMVRPGERLHVEVALRKQREDGYEFDGVGRVGQSVAVQGRFRLAPLAATD